MQVREAELEHLSGTERGCLLQYIALLAQRLDERLLEVYLFGSFARGDAWSSRSPMHSDVDLLVLCSEPLSESERGDLINETYPLFLECGRQIAPQFRTRESLSSSSAAFLERFRLEARLVFVS